MHGPMKVKFSEITDTSFKLHLINRKNNVWMALLY